MVYLQFDYYYLNFRINKNTQKMKKISFLLAVLTLGFTSCKNEKKETKAVETETIETAVVAPKKLKIALNAKSESQVGGNAKDGVMPEDLADAAPGKPCRHGVVRET